MTPPSSSTKGVSIFEILWLQSGALLAIMQEEGYSQEAIDEYMSTFTPEQCLVFYQDLLVDPGPSFYQDLLADPGPLTDDDLGPKRGGDVRVGATGPDCGVPGMDR